MFFALHFFSVKSIYLQSFLLITLVILVSYECKKKANNSKIIQGRVTVHLHCTFTQWDLSAYKVDISCSFRVMSSIPPKTPFGQGHKEKNTLIYQLIFFLKPD